MREKLIAALRELGVIRNFDKMSIEKLKKLHQDEYIKKPKLTVKQMEVICQASLDAILKQ